MYDDHVKRLRNCATRSAPCKTCDLYGDVCCTDTLMKQAADAIEDLSEQLENETEYATALNSYLPQWIPVTERLPEEDGCYLVAVKNDHQRRYSKTAWFSHDSWFARQDVTHWMRLPEPPDHIVDFTETVEELDDEQYRVEQKELWDSIQKRSKSTGVNIHDLFEPPEN